MNATLTDTHRAVLRYLVDAESVSEYTPRVEAGNQGLEGTAPYPTLRAMERRGLVVMHRRAQAAVGAPAVSYWTAELTDAGRDALNAEQAESMTAEEALTVTGDDDGNVTGDLVDEPEAVVTISNRAWSLLLSLLGEDPRHHALRLRLIKARRVVQRGLGEAMQLRGTRADIQEVGNVLNATANEAGRAFNQVDEALG